LVYWDAVVSFPPKWRPGSSHLFMNLFLVALQGQNVVGRQPPVFRWRSSFGIHGNPASRCTRPVFQHPDQFGNRRVFVALVCPTFNWPSASPLPSPRRLTMYWTLWWLPNAPGAAPCRPRHNLLRATALAQALRPLQKAFQKLPGVQRGNTR